MVQYHISKHTWWWGCPIWWAGGITWPLFSELSTDMPADLVLFNQTCLLVHWKSKRKSTCPMPLHQTCQLTLWTFINETAILPVQKTCRVESYFVAAAATYMPADLVLLTKHRCCSNSAAAIWMLAGPWPLNQHACRTFATQFWHSYCWFRVSLSAVPAGVVSHYRPCVLVLCLTISCACWCGASS